MEVLSVREFNRQADKRYNDNVAKFEFGKGGFPYRPMYVFQTPDGADRKRGFVAVKCHDNYRFCLTKKELNQYIKESEG